MSDVQIEQWHGKPDAGIASIVQGLFVKSGESRDIELVNWQYVDCPGGAHVSIAHLSGGVIEQPVALYAVFKNRMLINGKPVSVEDNANPQKCFAIDNAMHGQYFITRLGKKKVHLFTVI